ncbi:hypothetical protein [Tamlana flava]|uniref:hypothetical protein n=1 Tax=Tamlana flava TaxID=3158572 RepID=UPI00351B28A0
MKVTIDSLYIELNLVTYNDGLNFGRFFEDTKVVDYTISLGQDHFLSLMEDFYNQVRNEIKADDEAMNDTSDFSESGYCSLQELFNHEVAFSEIVKAHLGRPLLAKLFLNSSNPNYIINSIDEIEVTNEIFLKGRAFKKKL